MGFSHPVSIQVQLSFTLLSMSKPDTISSAINVNVHRNISRYDQVNKYGDYCIYYKTNYAVRPRKLWYRKTTYSVRLKL